MTSSTVITGNFAALSLPPQIITQPLSHTVITGSNVTLSVTAIGTQPLSYQWYQGSNPLSGQTASNLTLLNAQQTNAGSYLVVVSNSLGVVSSSVSRISVMTPTISWTGAGDGVSWTDTNNWSSAVLPTSSDSIFIGGGTNGTITVSGSLTLSNLLCQRSVTIGGNLSVAGGADIAQSLSVSAGYAISTSGSNAVLVAEGSATADAVSMSAGPGSQLSLAGLASYIAGNNVTRTLQAAPGSVLALFSLRYLQGPGNGLLDIYAFDGATVDLSGVTNIYGNSFVRFFANSNGTINLASLQTFTQAGDLEALGGKILAPNLSYISGVSLNQGLGGTLLLTGMSRIDGGNNVSTFIEAGGVLNLASVRNLQGPGSGGLMDLTAFDGATVDLSGVTNVYGNSFVRFFANSNGTINLSSLQTFTQAGDLEALGGTILAPNLSYMSGVSLNQGVGGTLTLTGLSRIDGGNNISTFIEAAGTLNLSLVRNLLGPGNGLLDIYAFANATADLSGVTNITGNGGVRFHALYSGGLINLIGLQTFTPSGLMDAENGGLILTNSSLSLTNISVSLAPTILAQPQSVTTILGSNVTLHVSAEGNTPLSYQWLFNQTNVLVSATDSTLSLTGVMYSQAGAYSVVVSNAIGSITSSPALLQVAQPLTLTVLGRGTVSISPSNSFSIGQTFTLSAAPASPWYAFSRWSDGNSSTQRTVTVSPSNNLYTAIFTNTIPLETVGAAKQWEQVFGGTGDDRLWAVQQTGDGGYVLGGFSSSGVSGNKGSTNYGAHDYWVIKTDANGNKQWEGNYGGSGDDLLRSLQLVLQAFAADSNETFQTVTITNFIDFIPSYTLSNATLGGGAVAFDPALSTGPFLSNQVVLATATPLPGWSVAGWAGDVSGTNNPLAITMNANKSVTAVFTTRLSASALPSNEGSVVLNPPGGVYAYGSQVVVSAVPAPGNYFFGWSDATLPVSSPVTLTVTNASAAVAAHFTTLPTNSYTLTTIANGPGSIFGSSNALYYPSGAMVSLTALPGPSGFFAGWNGDATGSTNPITVVMNSNKTVTASFGSLPANTYSLTLLVNGSGSISNSAPIGFYSSGQIAILTAAPESGYVFASWSGSASGNQNPLSIAVTSNSVITANFALPSPPVITVQPQSFSESATYGASFSVAAAGQVPIYYQWLKNGQPVSGATGMAYSLTYLQLADAGSYSVLVTNASGAVTSSVALLTVAQPYTFMTLAGSPGIAGAADGFASDAQFNVPGGLAVDSSGNVFVADVHNHTIRSISPLGLVSTLAGSPGLTGSADGVGGAARFSTPRGLAVDSSGNVYVADKFNHAIRKITPAGAVSTLAGSAGLPGQADGPGSTARFYYPKGVAVDGAGNLFVADWGNNLIRGVTPAGVVSTLAGSVVGDRDGTGTSAWFNLPMAISVIGSGSLYVGEEGGDTVRLVTPVGTNWIVSTVAGSPLPDSYADGAGISARFSSVEGVAVDASGRIYVADAANGVRLITNTGTNWVVTTLAGSPTNQASLDGTGSAAGFSILNGLALGSHGTVYVSDNNNTIRVGVPANPIVQLQPQSQLAYSGSSVTLAATVTGASPLSYQWFFYGTNLQGATNSSLQFSSASATQTGPYVLVVTNTWGAATSIVATLTVTGTVATAADLNSTLAAPNSPYIVGGNIAVSNLVIQPGVSVVFNGPYSLTVTGLLQAVGTSNNPITFAGVNPALAAGTAALPGWQGIRFVTANSNCAMSWCVVQGAAAGGLRFTNTPMSLTNCTVDSNSGVAGGGIYTDSTLWLQNCNLINNSAAAGYSQQTNVYFVQGGGLYIANGNVTLQSCLISNNTAIMPATNGTIVETSSGGGIDCEAGALTMNNCLVISNLALGAGQAATEVGGGVYVKGSLAASGCTFEGNSAPGGFGGAGAVGTATFLNCILSTNQAGFGGRIVDRRRRTNDGDKLHPRGQQRKCGRRGSVFDCWGRCWRL